MRSLRRLRVLWERARNAGRRHSDRRVPLGRQKLSEKRHPKRGIAESDLAQLGIE